MRRSRNASSGTGSLTPSRPDFNPTDEMTLALGELSPPGFDEVLEYAHEASGNFPGEQIISAWLLANGKVLPYAHSS